MNGIADFSVVKSYPIGMPFLMVSLTSLNSSYEFFFFMHRFIGPFMSVIVTVAAYNMARRVFPDSKIASCFITLLFAVSHDLQFQYHLARPQTIAILLFLVSLDYAFVKSKSSSILLGMMVATTFLFHPLTCAVLIGVCLMVGIFSISDASEKSIKKILVGVVFALLMILPFVIAHLGNTTLVSNYTFYFGESGQSPLSPFYSDIQDNMNLFANRTVGVLLFGVTLYEAINFFYKREGMKWVVCAWFFFLVWIVFSWVPIIFISNNAKRAATWGIVPTAFLVGTAISRLESTWGSKTGRNGKEGAFQRFFGKGIEPKSVSLVVVSLLLLSQVSYGLSYGYVGQRYISDTDFQVLQFIANEFHYVDNTFLYERQKSNMIAASILYPITAVANGSIRSAQLPIIDWYFDQYDGCTLVLTKADENLYTYALQVGWEEVLNPDEASDYGLNLTKEKYAYHFFIKSPTSSALNLIYDEDFDNLSEWSTNTDCEFRVENEIAIGELPCHVANWYHLYTDGLSINSTEGLFLMIRLKANTTGCEGRIFGYSPDGRNGNHSFYSPWIAPRKNWKIYGWHASNMTILGSKTESISFGFTCYGANATIYLDFLRIYRL